MPEVGIRELKAHTSEIIRNVRDERARYIITYRGHPVGVLLPLAETEPDPAAAGDPWHELTELGQQIGAGWGAGQTSAELLSEMRR
jgi:prevent-host-death family protein